jgi:cytochrome c oxidase cbb3-type subunit 3
MSTVEKDPVSGTPTTGHEWDGIRELNTPLPKWWLYVLYATIVWAIGYWVVYPAWPTLSGYSRGILGYSSRAELAQTMQAVADSQKAWLDKIAATDIKQIAADPELLRYAMGGGKAIFAVNCAPCHGAGGQGAKGFPNLADDSWIWGGTPEAILQTISYGVRNGDDRARPGMQMPSFGTDKTLDAAQINDVAEYVLSLTNRSTDKAAAERGKEIFAGQCASCHGDNGQGNQEAGVPRLNGQNWLYGGTKQDIVAQINHPRLGVMPVWAGRLTDAQIKMVATYVHSLGGGQ